MKGEKGLVIVATMTWVLLSLAACGATEPTPVAVVPTVTPVPSTFTPSANCHTYTPPTDTHTYALPADSNAHVRQHANTSDGPSQRNGEGLVALLPFR